MLLCGLIVLHEPDIAVLDLNLPDSFALEIVRNLRPARISTRFVVLCSRGERRIVVGALRAGVNAFLLESASAPQLYEAFRQVLDGRIYVSPSLDLGRVFSPQRSIHDDPLQALSAREYQVFSMLVEGVRAKEIGARLGLNPKTIDTYRVNLMHKLDIRDLAGLVKFAVQCDLASR